MGEDATLFGVEGDRLALPPRDDFIRALAALSVDGRDRFHAELVEALYEAEPSGDLAPVQGVIRAWYRSALFLARPGFPERSRQAVEDVKSLIGT